MESMMIRVKKYRHTKLYVFSFYNNLETYRKRVPITN